jgi:hypothetical protein
MVLFLRIHCLNPPSNSSDQNFTITITRMFMQANRTRHFNRGFCATLLTPVPEEANRVAKTSYDDQSANHGAVASKSLAIRQPASSTTGAVDGIGTEMGHLF